jgi:hypothetical protein
MDGIGLSVFALITGGGLIGLALALLRRATGRVMSASAMVGSLLGGGEGPAAASIAFIGGLVVAPAILGFVHEPMTKPAEAPWALLLLGGVCVGFGARLAQGGLVGALWGTLGRSGWAVAGLGAMAACAALSLFVWESMAGGGAA